MADKILLNCLPPASITKPSSQLSILKSFLEKNNITTKIKYWNFDIDLVSQHINEARDEEVLLPYFALIDDKHYTKGVRQNIIKAFSKSSAYDLKKSTYLIQNMKKKLIEIISDELSMINFDEIHLFGFTAKFHQWIPALVISEMVKKISPETPIVIGGFGSKEAAEEVVKNCSYFDFAIWGEGEYPLLKLHKALADNSNLNSIPRLIYRHENKIRFSEKISNEYLDFNNYLLPSYEDYFNTLPRHLNKNHIRIPINTCRSCYWNKCKFCDYNKGYKFRFRKPEDIVKEIEHYYIKYKIRAFIFVDNDIFISKKHFDQLLDLMIELNSKYEYQFTYWAEMIHNMEMDNHLFRKMKAAGLDFIFTGYEGISDHLLNKMDKSNSLIDNILFVKLALKNEIQPIANIIRDIPDETKDDVLESIKNLHYLRFFFNPKIKFRHNYGQLCITTMTKYYQLISDVEKALYCFNEMSIFLPSVYRKGKNRFRLLRWKKEELSNKNEWVKFSENEQKYIDSAYSYEIKEQEGTTIFCEYQKEKLTKTLVLKEQVLLDILKLTNNQVLQFDDLIQTLQQKSTLIQREELIQSITFLQRHHLIYADKNMSNIIAIIDCEK